MNDDSKMPTINLQTRDFSVKLLKRFDDVLKIHVMSI